MGKNLIIALAAASLIFSASFAEAGGYRHGGGHRGYSGGHYKSYHHGGGRHYRGHYSPQRFRWEGFALGLGTAIIGSAIIHSTTTYAAAPPPPAGHWEMRQVWVPPVTQKVWQNGYHNQQGQWVPGQWVDVEQTPGRWESRQVWVGP